MLGPVEKVKQMPLEKRRAPIFDLTAFDALHDWSLAIDRFLGSGDAVPTWNLANKGVKPILSESRGKDQAAAQIKRIAKGLRDLSRAISTCRAPEITEIASSLKEEMANCARSDLLPAFRPLLDLVKQKVSLFQGEDVGDGIQAAKWCLEHNLIQQGYTILNETLITHCVRLVGGDPRNIRVRQLVGYAAKDPGKHRSDDVSSDVYPEHRVVLEDLWALFRRDPKLAKIMKNLSDRRNDLNHAGYRENAMKADRFEPYLENRINLVSDLSC